MRIARGEANCGATLQHIDFVKNQLLALVVSTATALAPFAQAAEKVNTESSSAKPSASSENVTFGGGCFWCIEAVFQRLKGVKSVVSGYAGGGVPNPTYEQICKGDTGHAEVVKISFDPKVLSFDKLLEVF